MSYNRNECFFLGNLTRDPELRFTAGGTAIADLGVAINENYKKDDEWVEKTTFINCTVWAKLAEQVADVYRKGDQIHLKASYQLDQWEDKTSGEKKSAPKFRVQDVYFARRKKTTEEAVNSQIAAVEEDDSEDIPF